LRIPLKFSMLMSPNSSDLFVLQFCRGGENEIEVREYTC